MQNSKNQGGNGVNPALLLNDINYNRRFWFVRCLRKPQIKEDEESSNGASTPENDSEDSRGSEPDSLSGNEKSDRTKKSRLNWAADSENEDDDSNDVKEHNSDVSKSPQQPTNEDSTDSEDYSDSEEFLEWVKHRNEIKEKSHRLHVTTDPSVCSTHTLNKFNSHWLLEDANKRINDSPALLEDSKKIMIMWNTFSMRHKLDPFLKEPMIKACETFIDEYRETIIENNLINVLFDHFTNFQKHNLLTADEVLKICATIIAPLRRKKVMMKKSKSRSPNGKSVSSPPDFEVKERLRSARKSN